jgi:hypothetical protein
MTVMEHEDTPTVENAVRDWNKGQDFLFEFALKAHAVVGRRDGGTEVLAQKIRRSVDTVESYAAAGYLWEDMIEAFPSDSEICRDVLQVSFWIAIGEKYKSGMIDLVGAKNWLDEVVNNGWTVEKLRSMLPNKRAGESTFTRSLKKIAHVIERDILNAPALDSGMTDHEYRVFMSVAKWLHKFITGKVER